MSNNLASCPTCPVKGLPGYYMDHHILRCGNREKYGFGATLKHILINFKKAVNS